MQCQFKKMITPFGSFLGYKEQFICQKEAVHIVNGKNYCRHHSKLGRYVIREGDVGEIVFRCDTVEQLKAEFSLDKYPKPKYRMQKITRSSRRDII